MNSLLEQSENLQKEAYGVLEKMDLINILSKYGEPHIVGSVALGLMTWRDIDIEVVSEKISFENIAEIVKQLILQENTRLDFDVTDNRNWDENRAPLGLYLGLKYFGEVEDMKTTRKNGSRDIKAWQIDIHFVLPKNSRSFLRTNEIKGKLTEKKIAAILLIKNELKTNNPKYKKGGIYSTDIYNAVLDNNVKNIEDFKRYLKTIGKEW